MARADLIQELQEMGYQVTEAGSQCISFLYEVPTGRFAGQTVTLGFMAGEDWPFNPPSGPHVSPRLLPINTIAAWPNGGIHDGRLTPFTGGEWQYWSRPFANWSGANRSARAYMAHINRVFDALT